MIETKLNGMTKDITQDNIEQLKQLFPEIVTEDKIDFDKLKELLGEEVDDSNERYDFTWKGKHEAVKITQTPSEGTLRPDEQKSKNWDTTENLYIEGDNLEVLKLLQKSYYGKIKMIYLDPPYNTGKDFVYQDNFTDNLKNYLEQDENGFNVSSNPETSGRYHTNWLNMMYSRLKLARNVLKEEGIIFISIDDHEVFNLKKICDEIFGESNFIANIIWTNKEGGGSSDSKLFKIKQEYILVYAKNIDEVEIKGIPVSDAERYTGKDQFITTRGPFQLIKLDSASLGYVSSLDYPIEAPDGTTIYPNEDGQKISRWRWSKNKLDWGLQNGYVEFKKNKENKWNVYTKQYLNADNEGNIISRTNRPVPIIDKYSSTKASKHLQDLFDKTKVFDYSKPFELIKYLMELSISDDEIILDFFSGSATTAESLMKYNIENKSKNKFILVQLDEKTTEKSNSYKAGYKNICEIGEERIRRAGDKLLEESPEADIDVGFKVFKLDSSNLTKWNPDVDNLENSLIEVSNNIVQGRSEIDLVYELMLKYGLELTLPVEKLNYGNYTFYSIGMGSLVICLNNHINIDVADGVLNIKKDESPSFMRVVFKDNGFENDSDKTNVKEILRSNDINGFVTI